MKDRMIRAKFWPDKKVCEMSTDAQLVYIGIWGAANDFGVAPADPYLLKSDIDPRNTRWTMEKFKKHVQEIVSQKMIFSFMTNNEQWYYIPAFPEHQRGIRRPSLFGYPEPPSDYLRTPAGQCPSSDGQTPDNVQTMSVKCPPEVEEKRSRREGEEKGKIQHRHLDCVMLSDDEHRKLIEKLGAEVTEQYIKKVNNWCVENGKRKASYYQTILNWYDRDAEKRGNGQIQVLSDKGARTANNLKGLL